MLHQEVSLPVCYHCACIVLLGIELSQWFEKAHTWEAQSIQFRPVMKSWLISLGNYPGCGSADVRCWCGFDVMCHMMMFRFCACCVCRPSPITTRSFTHSRKPRGGIDPGIDAGEQPLHRMQSLPGSAEADDDNEGSQTQCNLVAIGLVWYSIRNVPHRSRSS